MQIPARHSAVGYRADIDGLRAVAIVAVLLYHGGFAFAGGGYVGVDVFFVVSGYLITSLILAERAAGRFTLAGFYERRIRRLFPALVVVLAASATAACFLFLPDALRRFAGSLFATASFSSNLFFWLETGYFQTAAELKPLIHTWSLAVEEQFYLLVPLLLLPVMRRRPRALPAWTIGILLVTLVAGEWAVRSAPSAGFYLTPFRMWELALGVLLALPAFSRPAGPRIRLPAAWLGLALIAWSVSAFSWRTRFPGLHALAPCAGTALVIWSGTGGDTAVKRLLSLQPLVFLGLISYSLYLWHWPILSFARYWAVRELRLSETIALLAASVALAALSWRYVEQPFRTRDGVLARRPLFAVAAGATGALAGFAVLALAAAGWPGRMDEATLRLAAAAGDRNPRRESCSFLDAADLLEGRACRLGAAASPPAFAVWGDSHADALMPLFNELATRHGVSGLFFGRIGCPPLLGVERPGTGFRCRSFNDAARRAIAESGVQTVVLVARWAHYSSEPTVGHEARTLVILGETGDQSPGVAGNDRVLAGGLRRTMESLEGYDVFVVDSIPEVGYDVPEVLARIRYLDSGVDIRPRRREFEGRQRFVRSQLDANRRRFGFTQLEPARRLCDRQRCEVVADGQPLYFDGHHLSRNGARFVAEEFEPVFGSLEKRAPRVPVSSPR
jgi:peptidoglycan/LPS O-acetylase OafA/YrhL